MWFLAWLIAGFVAGVVALLLVQIWWFFTPARNDDGTSTIPLQFGAQFLPFRIPYELKQLLLSPGCEDKLKKKETCVCLNLFVQFLYQEFRESKWFRRWIVKRMQMEFNELLSRTAVSKLLHDVKIRNFSVGTQFPVIKDVQVNKVTLAPDKDSFQDLDLTMDVEYRGGFEVAVDVVALLGRCGSLSVRVTRLSGHARLQMTRVPYSHWSFAFLHEPIMEFKVVSEFRGRPLPQLVPLIINQFRRTVRKKHVLPAYKVRYRPFFINPFLQPSTDPSDYNHVEPKGIVRVTIVKCTRLNLAALIPTNKLHSGELYCQINASTRPLNLGLRRRDDSAIGQKVGVGSRDGAESYVSIALRYGRHSNLEPFGLTMGKEYVPEKVSKVTLVVTVAEGSAADRAGFKKGDLIIAVSGVGITSERQAAKLMSNTVGDTIVLVERKLTNIENEDDVSEEITSALGDQSNPNLKIEFNSGDEFFHISYNDDDDAKSMCPQSEENGESRPMQRSHSDNEFTETGDGDQRAAIDDNSVESVDVDRTQRRKNQSSAGVLIPERKLPPSSESGGSYSPSTSITVPDQRSGGQKKEVDDQDSCSSSTASPPMSRKQRIAAKATEKVTQVAQKWTTGKATVKDIWDRRHYRQKQRDDETGASPSVQSANSSMTNSKSEEGELKNKINDSASVSISLLSPESSTTRQRSRSRSEPDTAALVAQAENVEDKEKNTTEPAEKDDMKNEENTLKRNGSTPAASSSQQQQGEMKKTASSVAFQSETKSVPSGEGEPVWYQNFPVPLDDRSRYLNVMVYWRGEPVTKPVENNTEGRYAGVERFPSNDRVGHTSPIGNKTNAKEQSSIEPVALGYATIYIPEVLDDCSITKSLCHQQTYALRPPSVAVKLVPTFEKMMLHPGFDPRLCYGDITLSFQWLPDHEPAEEETGNDIMQQAPGDQWKKQEVDADAVSIGKRSGAKKLEASPEYVIADGHKWLPTHFQQSVVCHICHKKVWLKSAYKCVQCDVVSHKKCIARAGAVVGQCGHVHETVAFESMTISAGGKDTATEDAGQDATEQTTHSDTSSMTELAADAVECITEMGAGSSGPLDTGKKTGGIGISERLAGLRRRRPNVVKNALAGVAAAHAVVPTSLESLSDVKWGSNEDNSPFHSLLYTKGGTYNEHMILAAKDLGKDLYTALPVEERKAKINEQIDRLQAEINETTGRRLEVLKKQGKKGETGHSAEELTKLDDKLQALAILMLHYCAGLQCCLDQEDIADGSNVESGDTINMEEDAQALEDSIPVDHHGEEDATVYEEDATTKEGATHDTTATTSPLDDSKQGPSEYPMDTKDANENRSFQNETMFRMDCEEEKPRNESGANG